MARRYWVYKNGDRLTEAFWNTREDAEAAVDVLAAENDADYEVRDH